MTTGLRLGIFLLAGRFPGQDDGAALRRARDAVVCAEAAGFDDAWIAEHHFMSYGTCPSAITFAAHALGATSRIGLGTAVSVLSTTHPVALAEQVALLDHLSDGRLSLGVGRGGPWVDLEVLGTGLARYEHGFAEGLDLLLRSLTQPRVAADGNHFAFREVTVVPRPSTRPRPPVVVAATSAPTVRLAAERGLPMLLGLHMTDDEKAGMVEQYNATARNAGHDPAAVHHVSAMLAQIADDRAQAQTQVRAAMPGWLADGLAGYLPIDGKPRPRRDPVAYTEFLCELHALGDPAGCAQRIRDSAARTGIRHVILMVEARGDHEATMENITRLGAEVLPLLRD